MIPKLPFWMVQRQIKAEAADDHTIRLVTPQLPTHEIMLRQESAVPGWSAAVYRSQSDAGDRTLIAETEPFPNREAAWYAAFELYRRQVIV